MYRYRVRNLRTGQIRTSPDESGLLRLGYTPEEILTMIVGAPVRGCVIDRDWQAIDPCTVEEISDITGIRVPTVYGIVNRALDRLRKRRKLRAFLRGVRAARKL